MKKIDRRRKENQYFNLKVFENKKEIIEVRYEPAIGTFQKITDKENGNFSVVFLPFIYVKMVDKKIVYARF